MFLHYDFKQNERKSKSISLKACYRPGRPGVALKKNIYLRNLLGGYTIQHFFLEIT